MLSVLGLASYTGHVVGVRERARTETVAEIKRLARLQIAEKGAANLSLREIARDMDVVSSALYRYFASRDELLTALIVDSYNDLGATVEAADAMCRRNDYVGRWMTMVLSVRAWALSHPSDYGLIFGTPVPGYDAPDDTTAPARRHVEPLLQLLDDAHRAGHRALITTPSTRAFAKEYTHVRARLGHDVPDEMLLAGLSAWATMFGAISFEIFGHVDTMFLDPGVHYSALITMLGEQVLGLD